MKETKPGYVSAQAAIKMIYGEKAEAYGDSLETGKAIGKVWGAMLKINDIRPEMVWLMMDALKTIRICYGKPKEDNWIDKIGYSSLSADSALKKDY